MAGVAHPEDFFKNKTVFLTGATGGLGGCLLYKLALELRTKKVFALIRSREKVQAAWTNSMPAHIDAIFKTGKVELVLGDITLPNFGISGHELEKIVQQTQIVINSAADISLVAKLPSTIRNNCLPPLELARLASTFPRLVCFTQISTAFVNCHLPDGKIEEKIYPLGDAKEELEEILLTGRTKYSAQFMKPYTYAKHIMERLLLRYFSHLPLLILHAQIRPTIISSAARSPFPGYGAIAAMPLESMCKYFTLDPGNKTFHIVPGTVPAGNILDEIPVDWVSNLVFLHIASKTSSIVHVGTHFWFPRTFGEALRSMRDEEKKLDIVFTDDLNQKQCAVGNLFTAAVRDWKFEMQKSQPLKGIAGTLNVDIANVDLVEYDRVRRSKIQKEVESSKDALRAKL